MGTGMVARQLALIFTLFYRPTLSVCSTVFHGTWNKRPRYSLISQWDYQKFLRPFSAEIKDARDDCSIVLCRAYICYYEFVYCWIGSIWSHFRKVICKLFAQNLWRSLRNMLAIVSREVSSDIQSRYPEPRTESCLPTSTLDQMILWREWPGPNQRRFLMREIA